jgi:hypothetical protein
MDNVDDLVSRIASKAGAQGPLPDVVTESEIPGYNVAVLHPLDRMVSTYQENRRSYPDMPYLSWPEGVVPMLSWGGFAEAAIDCMSLDGTVLLYECDVEVVAPGRAWKVDAPSLSAWWQAWLDGTRTTPTGVWHR